MSTFYFHNLPVDGIHEDVEFVQDPEWRVHVLPKAEDQRHRAEGLLATRESLDVTNAALHSLVIRIGTLSVLKNNQRCHENLVLDQNGKYESKFHYLTEVLSNLFPNFGRLIFEKSVDFEHFVNGR